MKLFDKYNRNHSYLRISVTDKCNLNCAYCNPKVNNDFYKSNNDILSFEEIGRIVKIFVERFEFEKIRLTGGEPFARKNIQNLITGLGKLKQQFPFELSATSNGILIHGKVKELIEAGLDRINFSLDSLKREKFCSITGQDKFKLSFGSISEAISYNPKIVKINMVVMKGINDDEIIDFVEFAINNDVNVRFIEYMPFSTNLYDKNQLLNFEEIIHIISEKYSLASIEDVSNSVSKDFSINGNCGKIGFITSMSDHFCANCNRLRITSDGKLKLCLFSHKNKELDLKVPIRNGESDEMISELILSFINEKQEMHDNLDELIKLKSSSMISIGG